MATYGNLPQRLTSGDNTHVYITHLNGWYIYRVTATCNRFHEVRWEVFVPVSIEVTNVEAQKLYEQYPTESYFERHDQAERFDTLRDALDFMESCDKAVVR